MKKQNLSTQPYKGARDFYPEDMRLQRYIFQKWEEVAEKFGYEKYDFPFLEAFDIYAAKTGEEIVNEQLYSFEDRGGRKVAIRPEATPSLARMVAGRLQELPTPIRWYSYPNLWRYEKPQRGRLREHYQLNVDMLGINSTDADAEVIALSIEILKSMGAVKDFFSVKINNRKLTNFVLKEDVKLNEEQIYFVSKAIDKKEKLQPGDFEKMLSEKGLSKDQIDKIVEYLETRTLANTRYDNVKGAQEIMQLFNKLEKYKVSEYCEFVPSIMRGFDYYTSTVFEVFDRSPENTRSMFGGGRYDDLLTIFGKESFPAVGFGMGDVTLKEFLTIHNLLPNLESKTKVMITIFNEELAEDSITLAQTLRSEGINCELYPTPSKLDKQLKAADRKGIPFVLIYGPEEKSKEVYQVKRMQTRESQTVNFNQLVEMLK